METRRNLLKKSIKHLPKLALGGTMAGVAMKEMTQNVGACSWYTVRYTCNYATSKLCAIQSNCVGGRRQICYADPCPQWYP
jgi:hypothetical protein